jgi:AraC-like DNA-binding protein
MDAVISTARTSESNEQLIQSVRGAVYADRVLLTTTLPRGGLHVVQPADVPAGLVRAYSAGFDADDRLSWKVIAGKTPRRMREAWDDQGLADSPYARELLIPLNLAFGVAIPLKEPVIGGYPGALHLLRSEQSGDFQDSEIKLATETIDQLAQSVRRQTRQRRKEFHRRSEVCLSVMDRHFHDHLGGDGPSSVDGGLREQMRMAADRHVQTLNGDATLAGRFQFPDSVGQHWNFRLVTYRRYPALGDGPFTFFCLQPECGEWSALRNDDFDADPELARMIPALRFMEREFSRMPTLSAIAASVHLSPFHFHRRFTELLGITPKQLLLDCQIEHAKHELAEGKKPLAKIAKEAGFAHQSHFTSRFKQATGMTPTRWRRLLMQNDASNN